MPTYTSRPWELDESSDQTMQEAFDKANDNFELLSQGSVLDTGFITAWWGTLANIPSGWALCDGANGTPDLRNRFIVGAGDSHTQGDTGGSKDAVVVSHTHTSNTGTSGSHSHGGNTNNTGGHSHNGNTSNTGGHRHVSPDRIFTGLADSLYGSFSTGNGNRPSYSNNTNFSIPWTSNTGAHSHNINTNNTGNHSHNISTSNDGGHTHNVSVGSSGESGVDKNMPPYKALYWIMKL